MTVADHCELAPSAAHRWGHCTGSIRMARGLPPEEESDAAREGTLAAEVAAHPLPPITLAEKAGALLLVGATVLIGLKPDLLLNWIVPSLQSPLYQVILKGGTP